MPAPGCVLVYQMSPFCYPTAHASACACWGALPVPWQAQGWHQQAQPVLHCVQSRADDDASSAAGRHDSHAAWALVACIADGASLCALDDGILAACRAVTSTVTHHACNKACGWAVSGNQLVEYLYINSTVTMHLLAQQVHHNTCWVTRLAHAFSMLFRGHAKMRTSNMGCGHGGATHGLLVPNLNALTPDVRTRSKLDCLGLLTEGGKGGANDRQSVDKSTSLKRVVCALLSISMMAKMPVLPP